MIKFDCIHVYKYLVHVITFISKLVNMYQVSTGNLMVYPCKKNLLLGLKIQHALNFLLLLQGMILF